MNRKYFAFTAVILLLVISVYTNMITGTVATSSGEVLRTLMGGSAGTTVAGVIWNIRLPRIIASVILGGALALSGYMLQTFFNNPIVGPFVLGISSSAKLTVALTLIFIMSLGGKTSSITLVIAAFFGAMAAMAFVLVISVRIKSTGILVVCGIMIGYICSAVTDIVVTFADDSNIVNLHNWSMGSFSGISMDDVAVLAVIVGACVISSIVLIKPMGAYRLGENVARSEGVNITLLRILLILISSLLSAVVTAFAGPISFVGIAIPHLWKAVTGDDSPSVMMPGCFLLGGVTTLICDGIARTVFAPTEVSVSSVTAVFLVPVVIVVMLKRKKNNDS